MAQRLLGGVKELNQVLSSQAGDGGQEQDFEQGSIASSFVLNSEKSKAMESEPPADGEKETIFDMICSKKIPAEVVFEDELCLAFRDVSPQAKEHVLLIPKTEHKKGLSQL
mmetsp:Transcript_11063/g.18507  ORF Transcript_11063/g.18507 Transcript_11063/m.18507 type:complete len:111 (-) Transcript_11063:253-585(-)